MLFSRSVVAAVSAAALGLGHVAAQDGFVCDRPSMTTRAFDLLEAVYGLEWCYDSDPVPAEVFAPSPLNLAGRTQQSGEIAVTFDAGYGSYIYGNGIYMGNIYIYEKNCEPEEEEPALLRPPMAMAMGMGMGMMEGMMEGMMMEGMMMGAMGEDGNRRLRKLQEDEEEAEEAEEEFDDCSVYEYGCILLDAPVTFGEGIGEWVRSFCASKGADLTHMIITHEHFDHVGYGNFIIDANPSLKTFIASEDTAHEQLSWRAIEYDTPFVQEIMSAPDYYPRYNFNYIIEYTQDVVIGNQTLHFRVASGHTAGSLIVYHEASQVLSTVDSAVVPKWAPFFDFNLATNIPQLYKLFDVFREFNYTYFMGGHLTHIGTPEDTEMSEEFANDILDAAHRVVFNPNPDPTSSDSLPFVFQQVNPTAPPNAGNTWLLFRELLNQYGLSCVDIVLDPTKNRSGKKWVEILAGVRAGVFSQCRTLADTLRADLPGQL